MSAVYANILEIAATDIFANVGGFTVATVGGISTITIPNSGLFKVTCHIKIVAGETNRAQLYTRANVLRNGVVVPNTNTVIGGTYVRGQADAQSGLSSGTTTLLLGLGDTVTFQMMEEGDTANTYTFGGSDSVVEIVEIPSQVVGVAGAAGADGADGADGTGGGAEVFFGAADPTAADGNDTDVWIQTTAGAVWKKAAGAWTNQYTFPSGSGVATHTRRSAISEDTTLDAAEVAAGMSSTTANVTTPTWGDGVLRYVYLGVPEDQDDITDILQNGVSDFSGWEASTPVVESHKWWRTTDAQDGEFSSGVTYEIVQ